MRLLIKTIQSLLQEMQQASPICFNNTGVESAANRQLLLWRCKAGIYQTLED